MGSIAIAFIFLGVFILIFDASIVSRGWTIFLLCISWEAKENTRDGGFEVGVVSKASKPFSRVDNLW